MGSVWQGFCPKCFRNSPEVQWEWMLNLWAWGHALRSPECRSPWLRGLIGPNPHASKKGEE